MNEESGAWRVQVGKGKSHYRTRYTLNSRSWAERYYEGLNIHSGYKKRLVDSDGKIVRRYLSDGASR